MKIQSLKQRAKKIIAMQHYTTIEQSKKLVGLGLNPETADMHYLKIIRANDVRYIPELLLDDNECDIPCWSLGALMDLLPPSIQTGEGMQNQYEIDIRKYWGGEENLYQLAYGNNRGISEEWHDMINTGEKESIIDAVFSMVCWLLENNYIKKGE